MGSFGETLRQARLDKGVSLAEAEQEIRIRRRYLEALENEDFSSLPAPVYARGMIRTYARYLGLSPDSMIDLFQAARPRDERLMIRSATPESPWSLSISLRSMVVVGGALAVVALLAVAWGQYSSLAETVQRAEEQQAASTLVAVGEPSVGEPTQPMATPTATPQPQPALPPTPTLLPPTPTPVPTPVEGVVVEATLRAATWMEVWVDDQKVVGESIPAGTTRLFQGQRSVRMLVANGAAVELVENGVARGLLDAEGRPIEVRWSRG